MKKSWKKIADIRHAYKASVSNLGQLAAVSLLAMVLTTGCNKNDDLTKGNQKEIAAKGIIAESDSSASDSEEFNYEPDSTNRSTLKSASAGCPCNNCVSFVKYYISRLPSGLNTYADMLNKMSLKTKASVGSVGVCRAWNSSTNKWNHIKLGHVFIVRKVNANGTLVIDEGSINGSCKYGSTINPKTRNVAGYWKP